MKKAIFLRLLKNAPACAEASAGRQMQVELCEIPLPLRGRPCLLRSGFAQAGEILRVASRRIRSDFLPRRRVGEPARGVLGRTPPRRGMRETRHMGVF